MFYKVVLNGRLHGQDIKNILWYRTGIGFDIGGLTLGGAKELADNVEQEVWRFAWKQAVSREYMLQTIEVYPINDNFQLAYSMPYSKNVNETGERIGSGTFSPAACVNIKFNLESVPIGQNFLAPKRGYIAVAGITEDDCNPDGTIKQALFFSPDTPWGKLAEKLSSNLENVLPPVVFFPVRVRLVDNPVSSAPLFLGWADVQGAVVDYNVSWRRSRRPS